MFPRSASAPEKTPSKLLKQVEPENISPKINHTSKTFATIIFDVRVNSKMATSKEQTEFTDGFSIMSSGMDSGKPPLALSKTEFSYGTNTTVRGQYLTHRPPYRKQTLILDAGVSIGTARFQGACYYKPDFGAESIVAQIGGRLYQFVPDTIRSATVYDRTIKDFFNGDGFVTSTVATTLQYSVVLLDVSDASGAAYPPKTVVSTDPAFITTSALQAVAQPKFVNNNTQVQFTFDLPLAIGFDMSQIPTQVFLQNPPTVEPKGTTQEVWKVLNTTDMVGSNPAIKLQLTLPQRTTGSTMTFPAGTAVFRTTNPSPPVTIATTTTTFTAPGVGQSITIVIAAPFPGTIGEGVLIGGFLYQVTALPQPVQKSTVTTQVQTAPSGSTQFSYDPNPAGISTAWLWQSENYVIINDGFSRPIFFNGVSSRRSITPTFLGKNTQSFVVPQIGQVVPIILGSDFQDAVGTFIQVSALDLFPFLMQVIGIDGDTITAVNITGQTSVGAVIPIGSIINSTASPTYSGVMAGNIPSPGLPSPGSSFQITVSPPFTGNVGDDIILTDGTGELTAYTLKVTAIAGGGSSLTVTNVNAPSQTIVQAGYPIVSQNVGASELPVGRMGAYVQGRNWISSLDGKSFIAGDLVGSSSGTQGLNYRDAVLKWSQNTASFPIPGGAGQINCIIALNALDASLGQGALQVLCDNDIFNCSAPTDSTLWAQVKTPILSESIIGFGGVGQSGAVVSNGDLIFKSGDGTIHSLKLSRQDFNQWGNLPISQEVNRVIQQENLNQLFKITETICDNRALISCVPIDSAGGIFSQGLIAIDFDVTSSLQGKLPSVYDGVWKDGNFLQLVSGKFNKVDRTFAFLWNAVSNTVELWEILKDGTADDDGTATPRPIVWSFESPMIFNDVKGKGEFDLVQLKNGEIYFSGLTGQATFKVWVRPDYSECWHEWGKFTVVNNRPEPSYFMRAGLGEPTSRDLSDALDSTPATVARFYQIRIEITGSLIFQGMKCMAVPFPENTPARILCD